MKKRKIFNRRVWLWIFAFSSCIVLFPLAVFPAEQKKNGLTFSLGGFTNYDCLVRMFYSAGYELKTSPRTSFSVAIWYAPLKPGNGYSGEEYKVEEWQKNGFKNRIGHDNFTQISQGGFALGIDIGCYFYFSGFDSDASAFVYIGVDHHMINETYRMFDNESSITQELSVWESCPSLDLGVGLRWWCSDRYSMKLECRIGRGASLRVGTGEWQWPVTSFSVSFVSHF